MSTRSSITAAGLRRASPSSDAAAVMVFALCTRTLSHLVIAGAVGALVLFPPSRGGSAMPAPADRCDRLASRSGDDAWSGRPDRPVRTAQRLIDLLRQGEVGCLAAGQVFSGGLTIAHGGQPGHRIILRSAPGGMATLRGRLWITDAADHVSVVGLRLDGRNAPRLPSPTINGDDVAFVGNDVTNHRTAICFIVGSVAGWGRAVDTRIQRNIVHDCGRRPATNHDHGIYVESARRTLISDNIIAHNADRGIQLYPNAQNTRIIRNIIDRNGEGVIISGDSSHVSTGTYLAENVISNSRIRHNIEAYWESPPPSRRRNVVGPNCVWNGAGGDFGARTGFSVRGPIVRTDPGVTLRAGRVLLDRDSKCRDYVPRGLLAGQPLVRLVDR